MEMLSYYMMFHNSETSLPTEVGVHEINQLRQNGWTQYGPDSKRYMNLGKHFFDDHKQQWYRMVLQFEAVNQYGRTYVFKRPVPMMVILIEESNDKFIQKKMINGHSLSSSMDYCKLGVPAALLGRVYKELQQYFRQEEEN